MADRNTTSGNNRIAAEYGGAGTIEESHHEIFKITTEVSVVHLAFSILSAFIVLFGMFSAFIKERLYAGEAIVATAIGIAFSPYAAGIFGPRNWAEGRHFDDITLEITRVVIALSVFAVGVELPKAYIWRHWRSLAILLGPNMLAGWLISGGLIYALIPGINFLESLVVAACVTPTDPILAASVVGKGKFAQEHVPSHIRHLLQAESGSNDGAAFPFLYLALFILLRENDGVGHAIGAWIYLVVLYQITLGIVIGAITGIIARKVMKFSKRHSLIDRESMVAMYVALALFVTGVTTLAGSDDLLAAFACGTAFAWDDWFSESIEDSNFSNIIDLLINCTTFIFIGATMPFDAWNDATLTLTPWRLVVLGILILLLRRLPVMFFLHRLCPDIKTMREAVFCGHFGPMGVGAIFIATLAAGRLPTPRVPAEDSLDILALSIQPIVYFLVLCSIIVHGLTIPFFSLGKRVHSISRTWTGQSGAEPSWLGRVRRSENEKIPAEEEPSEPMRNFDLEKGGGAEFDNEIEEEDISSPSGDGSQFRTKDYAEGGSPGPSDDSDETKKAETEDKRSKAETEEEMRHERHDREKDGEERWDEGSKVIVERKGGEEIEIIDKDPSPSAHKEAEDHPHRHLLQVPEEALKEEEASIEHAVEKGEHKIEDEIEKGEFALKRAAQKLLPEVAKQKSRESLDGQKSRESLVGGHGQEKAKGKGKPQLTDEERQARDDACRRERRDTDKDEKSWVEGNNIVIERNNGEDVDVVPLSAETAHRAKKMSKTNSEVPTKDINDEHARLNDKYADEGRHVPYEQILATAAKRVLHLQTGDKPQQGTSGGHHKTQEGGAQETDESGRSADGDRVERPKGRGRAGSIRQRLFRHGAPRSSEDKGKGREDSEGQESEDMDRGRSGPGTRPPSPTPTPSIRFAETDTPSRQRSRANSPARHSKRGINYPNNPDRST